MHYKSQKGHESKCYRCGIKGHWSRICRSSKHLANLYQASLKEKGKEFEVNLTKVDDPEDYLNTSNGVNVTHLEASDFFGDINKEVDKLIGDQKIIHIKYFLSLYHYIMLCKLCLCLN